MRNSTLMFGLLAGLSAFSSTLAFGQAEIRSASVTVFNGTTPITGGSATLIRTTSGLTATIHTANLKPGFAYTVWWVIFNHPEKCSPPGCNLDDVLPFPGNTAAGVSLVAGGGHLVPQSGKSDFGARLSIGDTSGAMFGPGLLDPFKPDVHLVLRSHGLPIPGAVDEQTSSFNGGCPPNSCANEQQAVFNATPAAETTAGQLKRIEGDVAKSKQLLDRIAFKLGLAAPE